MPIRLGIIGLSADPSAWASMAHVGPLKSPALSEKYKITAIATSNPESAKASAKFHGVPENKAYHSAEAIANDPDVDMVVVSVKVPLHKQMALPALKAKKPVYVEWPLGVSLAEAEELAAVAKKQGVKTVMGLQNRQAPVMLKAKEIIDSGVLGRIVNTTLVASSSMGQSFPSKYGYMNDSKQGVNMVSVAAAHILDPLCYILSDFKSLNATTAITFPTMQFVGADGKKDPPIERKFADWISVQGALEGGIMANSVISFTTDATPDRLEWIISGEKGSLKFDGPSVLIGYGQPTLYQFTPGQGAMWEEVKVDSAMFGGIGEVYAAYADGKEGFVDFEGAVQRHKMVEAIYRSAEKGTRESY